MTEGTPSRFNDFTCNCCLSTPAENFCISFFSLYAVCQGLLFAYSIFHFSSVCCRKSKKVNVSYHE